VFTGLNAIRMDLKGGYAVFQCILFADNLTGEFTGFAREDKTSVEFLCHGPANEETTGLRSDDFVDCLRPIVIRKSIYGVRECIGILKEGRDIPKSNPCIGEVRHTGNVGF